MKDQNEKPNDVTPVASDVLLSKFRSMLKAAYTQAQDPVNPKDQWSISLRMDDEQVELWDEVMNEPVYSDNVSS